MKIRLLRIVLLFLAASAVFILKTVSASPVYALVGVYGRVYDRASGQALNCVQVKLSWTSSDSYWGEE